VGTVEAGPLGLTECVYRDTSSCFVQAHFPEDVRIKLTLNVTNRVSGWLHGRILDPVIDITKIDKETNRLSITGSPAQVPAVHRQIPNSELPPEVALERPSWVDGKGPYMASTTLSSGTQYDFDSFSDLLPYLGDNSDALVPAWVVKSVSNWSLHPCLQSQDRLLGLVTTDAMFYNGGPPEFSQGRLNYVVGGLHRTSDNFVTRGNYNLVMRSDAARCLYGYTKAPVTAEITVTADDGREQVATTSMSERNGWLTLRASNFTFSTPKIQAVLVQSGSSTPGVTKLVCKKKNKKVKGPKRIVIKVKPGESATCPKGYRPKRR